MRAALALWTVLVAAVPAWPAPPALYRGDVGRTGAVEEGPEPPLRLAWKFKTQEGVGEIEAHPAVDDGLSTATVWKGAVYVGGHDRRVYCLDARTGRKRWEFVTGGVVNSTPAVWDGVVYVGSRDGYLYALRASDGSLVWKSKSGVRMFRWVSYGGIRGSPVVGSGLVAVGGCDGRVRALGVRDAARLWTFDTGTEGCYSSPALVDGTLYVGSDGLSGSSVFALDARSGRERWRFRTPTQIFATPAVSRGLLYVHARGDHVYALRAADGSVAWKVPAPSAQGETSAFADMAKSSPAVARGKVYVGVGRELLALDAGTGAVRWRQPTGGAVDSSPLVVGGTVYVGSDDRSVYGFDAETGRRVWSFATGGKVSVSPSAGERLLLVGSNDGFLYAFSGASGSAPAGRRAGASGR